MSIINQGSTIPLSEYNVLRELYESAGGRNWLWTSSPLDPVWLWNPLPWDIADINSDPCQWQGIICECPTSEDNLLSSYYTIPTYQYWYDDCNLVERKSCHVTYLNLLGKNLIGTIPSSIDNLPWLTHVRPCYYVLHQIIVIYAANKRTYILKLIYF